MADTDFSECSLIDDILCFLTYDEFCTYRKIIKKMFAQLSKNGKKFYKYYIYANIHMEIRHKDAIWIFLNDETRQSEFHLLKLNASYKVKL